jgi:Family of unknown function (DUF5565)
MKKIKTIFERDWDGDKTVIDKFVVPEANLTAFNTVATEKLDGMNIRLTIRNHTVVRVEKRRNPDKIQKHKGIEEPWYVDAYEAEPSDRYIFEAVKNTDLTDIEDGEWSGEALGKNIQGNPLNLENNTVCLFSCGKAPVWENVPTTWTELKEWLPKQKSKFGKDCGIEGIVWHCANGEMYKIKNKDFVKDNRR